MSNEQPKEKKQMAIRLRKFNRICPITGYNEETIKVGAPVIVQTDRGLDYGELISYHHGLPKSISHDVKLKKVIRYATAEDVAMAKRLPVLEEEALAVFNQKVAEHEIRLKPVNLEYTFDQGRLMIYYKIDEGKKAPNVRDLAKELSSLLKTRAELKQVSPRDEARLLGGLGPCGRPLCCSVWLEKPKHVTVKMVKEQGLSISPTKTAGVCGRLLCCLEYEHEKKGKEATNA